MCAVIVGAKRSDSDTPRSSIDFVVSHDFVMLIAVLSINIDAASMISITSLFSRAFNP